MLVTLAVLLLMMALVVQIFQAATGSMNAAQVYQRLDDDLRRLDSTIRGDLSGATAKFTPPLDPSDDQGYFEYVENEFADNDLEDCDDSIRLTVKAPDDRPFIGRMWAKPPKVLLNNGQVYQMNLADMSAAERDLYFKTQPVTVTSKHAEVMYFLRNGNLYRRVLLIAPELQSKIVHSYSGFGNVNTNWGVFPGSSGGGSVEGPLNQPYPFTPGALGGYQTSWQGVNDLSGHPAARGTPLNNQVNSVILNKLGDLTDRHHRFASPRWADDFVLLDGSFGSDGNSDDLNGDNVPDWYPTLSASAVFDVTGGGSGQTCGLWNLIDPSRQFTGDYLNLAFFQSFPFLYRGAFSQAQNLGTGSPYGWIHSPAPFSTDGTNLYSFNQVEYLKYLNHNPMDLGDNLPTPRNGSAHGSNLQTYWGFPTWRETLAPEWTDPTFQVNQPGFPVFPFGLAPVSAAEVNAGYLDTTGTNGQQLLPPMTSGWRGPKSDPFTDGVGATTRFFSGNTALWTSASWEDDLILTNVRSFDVKAFEPALADYADLGWGDDQRVTNSATSPNPVTGTYVANLGTGKFTPYMDGNWDAYTNNYSPNPYAFINGQAWHVLNQTFAHEGRMPPLRNDCRVDAQFGVPPTSYPASFYGRNFSAYDGNVGDNTPTTVRMRRIWDSWSTTYSKAIGTGTIPGVGFPYGPPSTPPLYPSYPAPYPAPLRGIQIQVRVTDPTNQRIKVLTIRQDFTDKL